MRLLPLLLLPVCLWAQPGIQRTMALLATSTPARRNAVRVLFYGQSITKQEWSQLVAQDLRTRFPYADLTVENRAIGGYSSPYLIQTVAADIYGFYPDLVIFHDYGDHENYEKIIAGIRRNTTAEILIQSDYPTWSHIEGKPDADASIEREAWHDRHSFEWLPELCKKYGCEIVDVRRPWVQYLRENHLAASDLLADGAHMNAQGNRLLADITKRYLRYEPSLTRASAAPPVRTYQGSDLAWRDHHLTLSFEGNRIDVIAAAGPPFHAEEADVRIDGKKPSQIPELYLITRPTDTFAVDWPAVNRVTAGKPLLAEDWTLRVLETNADDSRWRFEVIGSQTGPDGEGMSTERFVSKSSRAIIDPGEWGVKRAFDLKHVLTPVSFEVHWKVRPMFMDVYCALRVADPSREYARTLASGLQNGKHTLELISREKTDPPIQMIRVYRPPLI